MSWFSHSSGSQTALTQGLAESLDYNQVYNSNTDSWTLQAPMPTARSNAIAGGLCHGIVVIGGLDSASAFSNSSVVELYDPRTDSWCTGPPKPTAASEMGSTGVSTGRAIHAIGSGSFGLSGNAHEALREN